MSAPQASEPRAFEENPFRAPSVASEALAESVSLDPSRIGPAKRAIRLYRGMRTGLALVISLFALSLGGVAFVFVTGGEETIVPAVLFGAFAGMFVVFAVGVWIRAVWVAWPTAVLSGIMTLGAAVQANVTGGSLPFLMFALSVGVLYFAAKVRAEGLPLSARIRRGAIVV